MNKGEWLGKYSRPMDHLCKDLFDQVDFSPQIDGGIQINPYQTSQGLQPISRSDHGHVEDELDIIALLRHQSTWFRVGFWRFFLLVGKNGTYTLPETNIAPESELLED